MKTALVFPGQGSQAIGMGKDLAEKYLDQASVIREVCAEIGNVWPANFNSPGQVVISGKKAAVDAAGIKLKERGAKKIIPLAVSAPFHCPLMQPAADKLRVELDKIEIKDAQVPVVANVTADYVTKGSEIRELLYKQVTSPVLWEESVRKMASDGITSFIEVGPGKVLSGLIKKIAPEADVNTYPA
jgi:[acyl-carrier-protein] S-malonyltransferase